MTKDEALRLALEALEMSDICADDCKCTRKRAINGIKAALEAKDEPIQKQIIKIKTIEEPCNQVMALGQMMRDWLQSQIADSNTSVDVGKGLSEFDLWVQCEGKELFITIKEKK
jgi:hypothetical protein